MQKYQNIFWVGDTVTVTLSGSAKLVGRTLQTEIRGARVL